MLLMRLSWQATLACGVLLALISGGCGRGNAPTRYNVAGNVTFAGKPVPAGIMLFTPDGVKGNGAATCATIKNGRYDTSTGGKGVNGGPQIVRISGFDGIANDIMPNGGPLFPDYVAKVDLPKESTIHDFDVPGGHAGPSRATSKDDAAR